MIRRRHIAPYPSSIFVGLLGLLAWGSPAHLAHAESEPLDRPHCHRPLLVVDSQHRAVEGASVAALGDSDGRWTTDTGGRVCLDGVDGDDLRLLVVAEGFAVEERRLVAAMDEIVLRPAFGEELVVTSSRNLERLADVPVHLEVIGRSQIERTASRTLAEIIEWHPSIRVESTCQNCNQSTIRMMGLDGPYAQLLIDSQPTVSSLALVYGVEQLPARWIDSVEVVKGGGSALYGSGAVAGVINLIPHQATHTHGTFEANAGRLGGESTVSFNVIGDWASKDRDALLTAFAQVDRIDPSDLDGDGFTEVTRRELEAVGARFDRYLREGEHRFTAEVNHIHEERRGGNRLDLPPDQADIAEAIESRRTGAAVSWLAVPNAHFDLRMVASASHTARDTYYGVGRDPNAYGTTDNPLLVFDTQFNHHRDRSSIAWGLQATRDTVDDVQLGYDRRLDATYYQWGLFVQEERELGRHATLQYGVRLDQHSEVDGTIAAPRLALKVSPRPDLTLRATYARGFRPPVVFDEDLHIELVGGGEAQVVNNSQDLQEELSTSTLLSGEWRPTFGRKGSANLSLGFFHTELDDLFDTQETDDPTTPAVELTRVNFGRATVEGVEFSAALRWGSRLSADVGYVVQSARFGAPEPDFGSLDFLRTPEEHGVATLTLRLPRALDLFLGLEYTGPMWVPHFAGFIAEDRLERTPSFLTADLNLSRRFAWGPHRELTVTVGAKNLTNEYQADLDQGIDRDPSYVYGPRFPRAWFISARFEL